MAKISEEQKKEARERLAQYYADVLGISCREFERKAGLPQGYIKQYSCNPQRSTLALIQSAYPALNMEWVNTGEGNMWNPGYEEKMCEVHQYKKGEPLSYGITHLNVTSDEETKKMIKHLIDENVRKQQTIERLMEILAQMAMKN